MRRQKWEARVKEDRISTLRVNPEERALWKENPMKVQASDKRILLCGTNLKK